MSSIQYPAPVLLTGSDTDDIMGLLKRSIDGSLKPREIEDFFKRRRTAQLQPKPVNPKAGGNSYGHWGNNRGGEIFAHQKPTHLDIHATSGVSFMIARPGFNGAVWVDCDASGKVEFTALGMPANAFAGFAYKPGSQATEAIEHQITGHVTGVCKHNHALRWGPK
ncbi:hypothetical protein JDN40_02415 [Rhodomicrobium vannielii ATCC 17100]|uniref:hypothetical protein n=1 Tax=Rhodomicrobium vannielii TaxID=1069 RepID=UPI00191A07AD|nr:hypothetical protein [Rhodomicrobium vannielii]MBJ7532969.1 hypothetical protein [Rhodomicrobium vannielii ATCC 17100]